MHIRCGQPQSHIPGNSDEAVSCWDTHNTIEMDRLYWCTPPFPQCSCKLCMGPGAKLDQMRRSTHNPGACTYYYNKSNSSRPKWGQHSPLSDTHCRCTVLLTRLLSPQWREEQQRTLQQSGSSWVITTCSLLRAPNSVVSTRGCLGFFGQF